MIKIKITRTRKFSEIFQFIQQTDRFPFEYSSSYSSSSSNSSSSSIFL